MLGYNINLTIKLRIEFVSVFFHYKKALCLPERKNTSIRCGKSTVLKCG